MRLSTAIRLGSLAIQNPQKCNVHACAIGMAFKAVGKAVHRTDDILVEWPWTLKAAPTRIAEPIYRQVVFEQIYGAFDQQVIRGKMTIEALCDTIARWEDELEAKGVSVEQVTMATELNQPASPTQSVQESPESLEQDVAK